MAQYLRLSSCVLRHICSRGCLFAGKLFTAKSIAVFNRSRCFSSEASTLSMERFSQLAIEPKDELIKVRLLDENCNFLGEMSKADAHRVAFKRNLKLAVVEFEDAQEYDIGPDPVCQLVSVEMLTEQKAKERMERKHAVGEAMTGIIVGDKTIKFAAMNDSRIDSHLFKIMSWLEQRRLVKVEIYYFRDRCRHIADKMVQEIKGKTKPLATFGNFEEIEEEALLKFILTPYLSPSQFVA